MRSALTAALLLAAGCGDPPPARVLSVTVEPSDPLDAGDAEDFLRLAERLSPGGLAALRHELPDRADWPATSTRTVADLAGREDDRLRAELAGRALARMLADDPGARRWLDALGWSAGRFASVGASLGMAAVAGDLPDDRRLRAWCAAAEADAAALAGDGRVFCSLSPAERVAVLRRAACLPRRALLRAVLSVPPGNLSLVRGLVPRLNAVLPAGFDRTALDRLLSDRELRGVPFFDADPDRDDAALRWTGTKIVTGTAVVAGRPR